MNKIKLNYQAVIFSLFLAISLLVTTHPVLARANVDYWYIKDFKVDIKVNQDASLDITEKILADCGTALDKHGIFRVLPKNYQTLDGNFILPLELISIKNEAGEAMPYSVIDDAKTVTYKIGSADKTVQGENFYEIKYRYKNAIRTERPEFDEFYWNVLGNFWDLDIDQFSAQINFPPEINSGNTELNYYAGDLGSQEESDLAAHRWLAPNVLEITSLRPALVGEGITVSATFPKNLVTPYQLTFEDQYGVTKEKMISNIILLLAIILATFIICLKLWKKYGRDPHFSKTIIPEFEIPENLSPIEMGGIMRKGGFSNNFITATIIHLAASGYLKIENATEKIAFITITDFKLIRTEKAVTDSLYAVEALVLKKLFNGKSAVKLTDLKTVFYKYLAEISDKLLTDLDSRQLVDKRGSQYHVCMIIVGPIMMFIGFQLAVFGSWAMAGISISGLIVLLFGFFMSRLTLTGAELNWRINGFKLYMNTAEKYRSRFQEQEGLIEKLLPYAILFGITKKWLKKMKDIYGEEYFANYHPAFMAGTLAISNFDSFMSSVNEISSSISSNVSPSSSGSGGGGSSGGGGGGGGGGGW